MSTVAETSERFCRLDHPVDAERPLTKLGARNEIPDVVLVHETTD